MSEFAESRSGYPKFFRASPFADEVARNASPVPALLAIAADDRDDRGGCLTDDRQGW